MLKRWLDAPIEQLSGSFEQDATEIVEIPLKKQDGFTKRIVAALDVRTNDAGQSFRLGWACEGPEI